MQFDVFLSHNSKDKPAVRELARQLANRNIRVWLDEDQLIPGRNWQPLLEQGIAQSRTGAVVVGQDGLGPWEDEEMQSLLRQAATSGKPVIPVLLPRAPTKPKLPLFLGNRTWVDLRKGFTDQGMDKLVWGITGTPAGIRLAEAQHHEGHGMDVRTWWTWLLDKEHRAALGFVGAGIAAVAAAGWAVFVHFVEPAGIAASAPSVSVSGAATLQPGHGTISVGGAPGEAQAPPATSPPPAAAMPQPAMSADRGGIAAGRDVTVKAEPGGTAVIQTRGGTVTVNNFPPSTIDEIKKLGVTEAALSSFLEILEREQLPPEDLDSKLWEIAKRYQELERRVESFEQRLSKFSFDDPDIFTLKDAARESLKAGELGRADAYLTQAERRLRELSSASTRTASPRSEQRHKGTAGIEDPRSPSAGEPPLAAPGSLQWGD